MAHLVIHKEKVNPENIRKVLDICPFGGLTEKNGTLETTAGCRMD